MLNRTTSAALINVLKPTFARHGNPVTLVSDGAPNLVSDEFSNFLKQHCITHNNSSAYFPQSNGMVERSVQTCKKIIMKANESGSDIYKALMAYRSCPLACGLSPAQLFLGRRIRGTLPISTPLIETSSQNYSRNFKKEREHYKQYFDRRSKSLKPLIPNQKVRVYNTLSKTWPEEGYVVRIDGPRSYLIRTSHGSILKRNRVHLKPVHRSRSINSKQFPDHLFEQTLRVKPNETLSVPPNTRSRSKRVTRRPVRYPEIATDT